jgi:hypothetical protein
VDHWTTTAVTEVSRVVRHALASWDRTARLCVVVVVLTGALSAVLLVAHR